MLVVLALVSVSLAVSYSIVRSQLADMQVQANSNLGSSARQAAMTGIAAGLRRMHQTDWPGVGTTLVGALGAYSSYSVRFDPGDPRLTGGTVDEGDFPYRVTLTGIGTATSPTASGTTSTHRIEVVARLAPRQLAPAPPVWSEMLSYTFYQTGTDDDTLDVPAQVAGPVRLQGKLKLCERYPHPSTSCSRYASDLEAMRVLGIGDYRPFDGPVSFPYSRSTGWTRSLLSNLNVTTIDIPQASTSGWTHPGSVASYQLYRGGPEYAVPLLPSNLQAVTYQPDPRSNPAGLFACLNNLTLGNNVSIRGTLITAGDVEVTGSNVHIESVPLASLEGSEVAVHVPAAVVRGRFRVADGASLTVRGVVACWDRFEVRRGLSSTRLDVQGRVIARNLVIAERSDWDIGDSGWNTLWNLFQWQLGTGSSTRIEHYPVFVAPFGFRPQPLLTIRPETSPVAGHWHQAGEPVYVPQSGDPGLRWSVIRWTDSR